MADEFAVYKEETFLDEGSAEELNERLNVQSDTVRWTPTSYK